MAVAERPASGRDASRPPRGVSQLRVLGPLDVVDDGRVLVLPGHKQQALLALLALHANQAVPLGTLLARLWPVRRPATAKAALRNNVSLLRRFLEAVPGVDIDTVGSSYRLRARSSALDVESARRLVEQGRLRLAAGQGVKAGRLLGQALGLWRGRALPGLRHAGLDWPELDGLDLLHLDATEGMVEAALQCGQHREYVPALERLTREHPGHEPFHRQRVAALAASGRTADAVRAFHDARGALERAGRRVGPELDEVHRQVLEQGSPAGPGTPVTGPAVAAPAPGSAEIRAVSVLCARFAAGAAGAVPECVELVDRAGGTVSRREAREVVALFGLGGPVPDGMDGALSTAIEVRRRARDADRVGPAVAVVTGRVLLLDRDAGRVSVADRTEGVVRECERLVQGTAYGAIRTR